MAAPPIALGPASIVAQISGTPGASNPFNAEEWTPSAGAVFAQPPAAGDTRKWNCFGGDEGVTWDDGNGGVLTAYGDTFGFDWIGPFSGQAGNVSTTISATSDGLDLTTLTGTQSLFLAAIPANLTSGSVTKVVAVLCQSGSFAYIAYTTTSASGGNHIVNCTFICKTGSGSVVCHTGDVVQNHDDGWTGLADNLDVSHRNNTLAYSTDADLSDGPTISAFKSLSAAGTAREIIPGGNGTTNVGTYATTVAYTSAGTSSTGGVVSIAAATHGMVIGQWFHLTGDTKIPDGYYQVTDAPNANTIKCWSFLLADFVSGSTTVGTLKAATLSLANSQVPMSSTQAFNIPTGGVAVPRIGSTGGMRQFLFHTGTWFLGGGTEPQTFSKYMGLSYSDDGGDTWVDAKWSAKLPSSLNGKTLTNLTDGSITSFTVTSPGGTLSTGSSTGVMEIDTSGGVAYIAFTNRVGNVITIAGDASTLVRGTGSWTMATGNGARFGLWSQNTTFTAFHQNGWPWRPGDGFVYVLTTISGRSTLSGPSFAGVNLGNITNAAGGSARMMRCPEASLLDKSAWTYFTGFTGSTPNWSTDSTAATNIFPDGHLVAEPSMYYHEGTGLYLTTYLETGNGFVLRSAPNPWGPWSSVLTIIPSSSFGMADCYGGSIHPWSNVGSHAVSTGPSGTVQTSVSSGNQSPESLFFIISLAAPYGTYLAKAILYVPRGKQNFARQAVNRSTRY